MANKEELIQKQDLTKVPKLNSIEQEDTILCVNNNKVCLTQKSNISGITELNTKLEEGWYKIGKISEKNNFLIEFEIKRVWNDIPNSTGLFYILGGYPKLEGVRITHPYKILVDKFCIKDRELYLYHPSSNGMKITSKNSDLILYPKAEKVDSVPEDLIQEFKTIKYE